MLEQKLRNHQPGPLQGLGVVVLILCAAVAGSMFFSLLQPRIGLMASVLFIAYGCGIAWVLLNQLVMGFIYTANDSCLRVCRTYGKRERFVVDVWLNRVLAYGTPQEVRQRYPHAHVTRATRAQSGLAPFALAYRDSDKEAILIIQPDQFMREHLVWRLSGRVR